MIKLSKKYGDKKVVSEVSMIIDENEIVCILGNNGAGKTTLINMLVGLVKPSQG